MTTVLSSYTPVLISSLGATYRRLKFEEGVIKLKVAAGTSYEVVEGEAALTMFAEKGALHTTRPSLLYVFKYRDTGSAASAEWWGKTAE